MSSKPKKLDRRIRRTRRQLKTALFDLMNEKSYDDITVSDIVDHADISRATFYLHYTDKDDLLYTSFSSIVDDVKAMFDDMDTADSFDLAMFTQVIFKHVYDHQGMYDELYKFDRFGTVMHLQISQIIPLVVGHIDSIFGDNNPPPFPIDYYGLQIVSVTYATLRWSLDTQHSFTPDDLTHMVTKTLSSGIPFISST